jgi:serine O-acetyltransferase
VAREPLTQDYAAHELFAFAPPTKQPWSRITRWSNIAFSQSWLAVLLFRLRERTSRMPIVPGVCDLLSRALFRVQIGRRVTIGPGLMIPHGNAVIDGATAIGRDCQINPWVTIGLSNSRKVGFSAQGPTIGDHVHIGTGAKILGALTIGDYARIGANAVVLGDVPAHATVVGAPARVVAVASAAAKGVGDAREAAAQLRAAIVDYKLHRCSLVTLAAALSAQINAAGALAPLSPALGSDIVRLRGAAGTDGQSSDVREAIERIDAALRSAL